MNVKLSVIKDGEVYKQLTVALPVVIGRGTEAGLTIKHPLVSRKHCELFAAEGSVQVKDLFSLNGTFVDGDRVDTQAVVATGSELKLGVVEMTVEFSEVLDAPSTAVHEPQEPVAEVVAPETADLETVQVDEDESVSAADNDSLAEIGDFEVSNDADGGDDALDLGDFEINEDASGPAESEALDLGDFEVSKQGDDGEAVDEMPSLMDLANMADEDVEAAASAEQPAAPPEQKKTDDDNDDELQAFLNDLGG
ncbi:MAG: FHA domain-containing protein [Pirellulales bacterium]|nr:FHA domain-containing protein [Pirellulales bacterium]